MVLGSHDQYVTVPNTPEKKCETLSCIPVGRIIIMIIMTFASFTLQITSAFCIRLGLAPVKGPCHSDIERGPESFSLNVLGESEEYMQYLQYERPFCISVYRHECFARYM